NPLTFNTYGCFTYRTFRHHRRRSGCGCHDDILSVILPDFQRHENRQITAQPQKTAPSVADSEKKC
ncbi:MAG: hypothetical protein J6R73_02700, partial [Alistipes sp.]|nr:hypothetical protein [Alistipes sp.]